MLEPSSLHKKKEQWEEMKSEQYKKTIGLVLASDPKKTQNFHKIGPLVREKK